LTPANRFSSLFNKDAANGVSVSEGARALTRIPDAADSAAKERVSPSNADLAEAMDL
jgi:hypothetical protein